MKVERDGLSETDEPHADLVFLVKVGVEILNPLRKPLVELTCQILIDGNFEFCEFGHDRARGQQLPYRFLLRKEALQWIKLGFQLFCCLSKRTIDAFERLFEFFTSHDT